MTITANDNISLLKLVEETFPQISTSKAKKLILYGCITKKGAVIKSPEIIICKGEKVEYSKYVGSPRLAREKTFIPVLMDDIDFVAVLKASGHRIDALPNEKEKSIFALTKSYLRRKWGKNTDIFIVENMLQGEAGICLFAKNKRAQVQMRSDISKSTKEYHAIVEGKPKFARQKVNMWISKDENNYLHSHKSEQEGAIKYFFSYETVAQMDSYTHIIIKSSDISSLYICFMLNQIGNPIVGDRRFGNHDTISEKMYLYLTKQTFLEPQNSKRITVETVLPQSFDK
jgi:Pseudouridylate synthases, 23S RNA-specific